MTDTHAARMTWVTKALDAMNDAFELLGGVDGAADVRDKLLAAIKEPKMTTDKHDDALIAQAAMNVNHDNRATGYEKRFAAEILRLERSNWQPAPKPDRAEVLMREIADVTDWRSNHVIIRRHFDELRAELRAEWEAERPAAVVPRRAQMWAESRLNKRSSVNLSYGAEAADFILSLIDQGEKQ